jgi:hypothetical protein
LYPLLVYLFDVSLVMQWPCARNCFSSMSGAASTNWGNLHFQEMKNNLLLIPYAFCLLSSNII